MARERFDDLDDDTPDDEPGFDIVVDAPPARRPINLRPILLGLLVLVLGGALGGAIYLLTAYDTRGLIGLLDIGEAEPRLSLALPGQGEAARPAAAPAVPVGSGLLTPPGGAPERDAMLKGVPAEGATPPPATPPAPPALPATVPLSPSSPPPSGPAAPAPASPEPAKPAPARAGAGTSTTPLPRPADKPPSFDTLPALKGEVKALPSAPLRELLRKAPAGDLPGPGPDGRLPWQVYARPWSGPADKGRAAVVVTDLGLDKAATEAVIAHLPPEVTLAFSPYAPSLDKWIKKARDHGHEVLLVQPAERADQPGEDPGPYGLTRAATPEANLGRIETVLARGPGAGGLLLPPGPLAVASQMPALLAALKERGLMVVGGDAPPAEAGMPFVAITQDGDQELFREAIDLRLNQVGLAARSRKSGLVVVRALPLSLDRLLVWIADLPTQGVVLAPASALVSTAAPAKKAK
jgi:polysaccharide deacetylase 2 family uncharacterized protein YibQ